MDAAPLAVFVLSAFAVFYTFAGYAVHIFCLARLSEALKRRRAGLVAAEPLSEPLPEVTVVLVAFNEAGRIQQRVGNLLESEYPEDRLRVLVVSDGSTDETVARVPADRRVAVLARPERSGKASCLNAALAAVTTELVVFADARQQFDRGAIHALAVKFADPAVGAISGALEIASSGSNTGAGVDLYWRLEKWIRASESRLDSAIGCTGAIYAIRRKLFQPIPADTLLDDVVIPMQILLAGRRVLFEKSAVAWDPQSLEPEAEQRRKRRTLAGNFQMLFRYPEWLLPWKNRCWWQLIAHKYLRLAAPLFLLTAFLSNAAIVRSAVFGALFACQCALYATAVCTRFLPRSKLVAIPSGFVFLNLMTLRAFWFYLTSKELNRWEVARTDGKRNEVDANPVPK